MATVADRFGMSVERLIDLNADLISLTDENFIVDGEARVSGNPNNVVTISSAPAVHRADMCQSCIGKSDLHMSSQTVCIIPDSCSLEPASNSGKNH